MGLLDFLTGKETTTNKPILSGMGPRGGQPKKLGFIQTRTSTPGFSGFLTKGVFIFIGWLLLAGALGWSGQLRTLTLIGAGIFWLSRL